MIDIIFVDDDPAILSSLKRSSRMMREKWSCDFANGPEKALEKVSSKNYDLIISDMRMPTMDGATLLNKIKQISPQTVRFILSGQSARSSLLRSLNNAHQYLSKPFNFDELGVEIERTFEFQNSLNDSSLKNLLTEMDTLPSLSANYDELTEKLNKDDGNIDEISKIVSQDIGMTAKILQVVNSSYFGGSGKICSPVKAAKILGLDLIKEMVFNFHVFKKHEANVDEDILKNIWKESINVGNLSSHLAKEFGMNQDLQETTQTAGFLQKVGLVILATGFPGQYQEIAARSNNGSETDPDSELDKFNIDYSILGSCLAGLWGLPGSIADAISFHKFPSRSENNSLGPLVFVHIAYAMLERYSLQEAKDWFDCLDYQYLTSVLDLKETKDLITKGETWIIENI